MRDQIDLKISNTELGDLYDDLLDLLAEMEKRHYVNISEVKKDFRDVEAEIEIRKQM